VPVAFADVKPKLMTLEQVRKHFQKTEPLDSYTFPLEGPKSQLAQWKVQDGWNEEIDELEGLDEIDAHVHVGTETLKLTKDALLEATSLIGMTKRFAEKSPAKLLNAELNYWYANNGAVSAKELKVLSNKGVALAFTKGSVDQFSNLKLLDAAEEAIQARFGKKVEIWADYKFEHSLRRTCGRLVVPTTSHSPRKGDEWCAGVQIKNSIVGEQKTPLSVTGYLFRYDCTNGAITVMTGSRPPIYKRQSSGSNDEAYVWAKEIVDEVCGDFDEQFHRLDDLAKVKIPFKDTKEVPGKVRAMFDIFETYAVPMSERDMIMDVLRVSEDNTMYGIMQAVSQIANVPGLRGTIVEKLMAVAGDLPKANEDRCGSCLRLPV
jgi:hypothetical protein